MPSQAKVGELTAVPIAPGASVTISGVGTMVYLPLATNLVNVRTRGRHGTSAYMLLSQGMGIRDQEFEQVDLQNPNATIVVVQVWTGLSNFIDRRLILANQSTPNVIFPTYPTANAAASVNFVDKSGSVFVDINLNVWIALYRVALIVCNVDNGITFLLQKSGATTSSGPAVAAIYPLTSLNLPVAGDYTINVGGANINVIGSEIYSAIPYQ